MLSVSCVAMLLVLCRYPDLCAPASTSFCPACSFTQWLSSMEPLSWSKCLICSFQWERNAVLDYEKCFFICFNMCWCILTATLWKHSLWLCYCQRWLRFGVSVCWGPMSRLGSVCLAGTGECHFLFQWLKWRSHLWLDVWIFPICLCSVKKWCNNYWIS